jgi:transposase-like protein
MKDTNRNGNGAATRRKFDEPYKRHAVELTMRVDRTVKSVAEEIGVNVERLYNWRHLFGPRPSGASAGSVPRTREEAEEEVRQLRAELVRMREREIVLKKSLGILSEAPESGMPRLKR